jgi:hypothetical protein
MDLLVLQAEPQPLDKDVVHHRPLPSMLIRTPAAASVSANAALVNRAPWLVLKISGRPLRSASSRGFEAERGVHRVR